MSVTTTTITITSSAFANGAAIPARYTADGQDISPPLQWAGVPAGTKELALICDDPDAPRPQPWVHWVVYKIPPTVGGLSEGISPGPQLSKPFGAVHGKSTTDELGYHGPNPPRGHGVHHYRFRVYALDCSLNLQPGASKDQLLAAMKGHILSEGELVGTYKHD